ncbi:MAG: hypothetical protein JRN23_04275 [Nitrososphaerota archaeon]|nr:hypothetical protein [Nitrososphaerota archaeon]
MTREKEDDHTIKAGKQTAIVRDEDAPVLAKHGVKNSSQAIRELADLLRQRDQGVSVSGESAPAPTAQSGTNLTTGLTYFLKEGKLCKKYGQLDYDIASLEEIDQVFHDRKSVDNEKVSAAERGFLGFYELNPAEQKQVSADFDLAKKAAELQLIYNKAKAAKYPPGGTQPPRGSPGRHMPDYARCPTCERLLCNLSPSERAEHERQGGRCAPPRVSLGQIPGYMKDPSTGKLLPEIRKAFGDMAPVEEDLR